MGTAAFEEAGELIADDDEDVESNVEERVVGVVAVEEEG